jgi:soluble lytic murein transglycosylase-like protein
MRLKLSYILTVLAAGLLISPHSLASSELRRIVHPDGRVEFTNVGPTASRRGATPTKAVYSYRDRFGVWTFSDQKPEKGIRYELIRVDCYACQLDSSVNWHNTQLFADRYREQIEREAKHFDVDPALVRAVIHAESAFNPKAVSPRGAQGLMQLMPPTAEELGIRNALDVDQNIHGGVKYLATLLKRFDGDTTLATAAYNAGPGAVHQYDGVPPFAETKAYTERVAILHQRYRQAVKGK